MDTTPEYIKMCEKAEEIQALRRHSYNRCNWQDGDYFYTKSTDTQMYHSLAHMLGVIEPEIYEKKAIWLPRQDQLQEMVVENIMDETKGSMRGRSCSLLLHSLLNKFAEEPYGEQGNDYKNYPTNWFDSQEQLWLAFVMKDKYNKVWTGEEWKIDNKDGRR